MIKELPWLGGAMGGTVFATLSSLSQHELRTTVVVAIVGALVSCCTTLIFRELVRWLRDYLKERGE